MDKEIVRKEELLGELTKAKVINKIIKQNLLKEVKETIPMGLAGKIGKLLCDASKLSTMGALKPNLI